MLGSASIQVRLREDGREKVVVFSGDLGPKGAPILRDFEPFREADLVFLESTYGDRDHRPFADTVVEFVLIIQEAVQAGGKVIVPTFAVGRAQLLMMLLSWMFRTGKVKPFPVFLDSPMAVEATRIYTKHTELFDDDMMRYMKEGSIRQDLRTLNMTVSADESKAINTLGSRGAGSRTQVAVTQVAVTQVAVTPPAPSLLVTMPAPAPPVAAAAVVQASHRPAPIAAPDPAPTPAPAPAPNSVAAAMPVEPDRWTGGAIRRAREARRMTLEQLAERTRITRHHLMNVEADAYPMLPAVVYLRGIIMSVARELRLDGPKVARSYIEFMEASRNRSS